MEYNNFDSVDKGNGRTSQTRMTYSDTVGSGYTGKMTYSDTVGSGYTIKKDMVDGRSYVGVSYSGKYDVQRSKPAKRSKAIRKNRSRRSGFKRVSLLIAVAAVLIACGVAASYYLSKPYVSVDLAQLYSIKTEGYDTNATATAILIDDAVDEILLDCKNAYDKAFIHLNKPSDEDYILFRNSLQGELSNCVGLANGSTVYLTCLYDKELAKTLNIEVTNVSKSFPINGLTRMTMLSLDDMFAELAVVFDGISPNLTVSVTNLSTNPFISGVNYEIINPKETYSDGDMIQIRAIYSEEVCLAKKYLVDISSEECIRTYAATSTSSYLLDAASLPDSVVSEAIDAGRTAFDNANEYGVRIYCEANLVPVYINKQATFQWTNITPVSAYLKTVFPEHEGELGLNYNDLDIIYKVGITQADGVSCTAYAAVRFSNIVVRNDGSLSYDFSNAKIMSASYYSKRVKKNVTDSYVNTHEITQVL